MRDFLIPLAAVLTQKATHFFLFSFLFRTFGPQKLFIFFLPFWDMSMPLLIAESQSGQGMWRRLANELDARHCLDWCIGDETNYLNNEMLDMDSFNKINIHHQGDKLNFELSRREYTWL